MYAEQVGALADLGYLWRPFRYCVRCSLHEEYTRSSVNEAIDDITAAIKLENENISFQHHEFPT